MMNIWRLIAHHNDKDDAVKWVRNRGRLAIGWGKIGTIRNFHSADDITVAIKAHYPALRNAGSGGVCLFDFCYRMQQGDFVILSTGSKRVLVMEVEGDYEFRPLSQPHPTGDYQNQRTAKIVPIDPDELWRRAGAK